LTCEKGDSRTIGSDLDDARASGSLLDGKHSDTIPRANVTYSVVHFNVMGIYPLQPPGRERVYAVRPHHSRNHRLEWLLGPGRSRQEHGKTQ